MFDKKKNAAESYGVIGLGRFGTALVKTLAAAGKEVIAVDKDEAKVKAVRGYTDYAFVIDELDETSLKETCMQNCGTVTICIGEQIDISILTTMLVTKLGVPHVISKAASEVHGEVLKRLGAEVVYPEADMAVRIGKRLISGNLLDYIALGDGVEVRRITVGGRMLGKSVRTLDLRKAYGINIIAVEHGQQTNVEFSADYTFKEGDTVAVIGKVGKIDKFEKKLASGRYRVPGGPCFKLLPVGAGHARPATLRHAACNGLRPRKKRPPCQRVTPHSAGDVAERQRREGLAASADWGIPTDLA